MKIGIDYCPNPASKEFQELKSIFGEAKAYLLWDRNHGNPLDMAPNGAQSQLFQTYLDLFNGDREKALVAKSKVYLDEFLNWFGDWTNDSENASKVVDENGEPLVVYHGSNTKGISTFSLEKAKDKTSIFTTSSKNVARSYVDWINIGYFYHIQNDELSNVYNSYEEYKKEREEIKKDNDLPFSSLMSEEEFNAKQHAISEFNKRVYSLFINLKKPLVVDAKGSRFNKFLYKSTSAHVQKVITDAKSGGYDGVILLNVVDNGLKNQYDTISGYEKATDYIVFDPNQIKSATDNNGDFSTENDNIYYHLLKTKAEYTEKLLKEKGLAHRWTTYNGKSILFAKKLYDERGNIYYPEHEIEQVCNETGAFHTFYKNPNGKSMIVNLYDGIESASKEPAVPEVVLNLAQKLSKKFPGITFKIIDEQDVPRNIRKNACCWTRGGIVYLINGRVTEEMTFEEFLHPFVSILQKYNSDYFYELVEEIKSLYPKLIKDINAAYSDFDGFNQDDRDNEYVAQGLAKLMNERKDKTEKVRDILQSFGQWFYELVRSFLSDRIIWSEDLFTEAREYTLHPEKLKKLKASDLARLLGAEDLVVDMSKFDKVDKTVRYHMADPNRTLDQIAADITKQFDILYKSYAGNPNKTVKQQEIQNEVFEKLGKLRELQDETSIEIALDTGISIMGGFVDGVPSDPNSISGILYKMANDIVPYMTATPEEIVNMYKQNIGFFGDFLNSLPKNLDLKFPGKGLQDKYDTLSKSLTIVKEMWQNALVHVVDSIIDNTIDQDVTLGDESLKDDMKIVFKDWAHTNFYYGDMNQFEGYIMNYGQANNPIIKMAFNLIQHAESKIQFESQPIAAEISKLYKEAKKEHRLSPDWQTVLMEFDADGKPTGNFVRDINYGQYRQDLQKFMDALDKEFVKKYKHTYILDETGTLINNVTRTKATDEEWSDVPGAPEPHYVEYMRRIYEFKCSRAHLRYTYDYYKERLSQPYSENNPSGHGLSPKTLHEYNRIQSNINYYLDLCTDKETGLHHPELLSPENKAKLNMWEIELKNLSSVFDAFGELKTDDKRQMAEEISAWQRWLGEKLQTEVDLDEFFKERQQVIDKVNSGEYAPEVLRDFDRYNASFGINQDFINQTIGQFENPKGDPTTVVWAKIIKSNIKNLVSVGNNKFEPDLTEFESKKSLWLLLKAVEQEIDDNGVRQSAQFNQVFQQNFKTSLVLYRDEYGYALDKNGNRVQPQDEENNPDLLTYLDYMIDAYTTYAEQHGYINGLVDDNGNLIKFSGTHDEIQDQVSDLFYYTHRYFDKQGTLVEEQRPVGIFSVMEPIPDKFNNLKTGRIESTKEYIPRGRFATKSDKWHNSIKYYDDQFDRNALIAEQPKRFDSSGNILYDNTEAFNKLYDKKNGQLVEGATKRLYNKLVETMTESQKDNGYESNQFDYRLPQINASDAATMSRVLKNGIGNTAKELWASATSIQANDVEMRKIEEGLRNPDGSIAVNIPHRFIAPLKNPETITHDVTSAVIMFMQASKNYKYKTQIQSQLEAIRYALDKENRDEKAIDVDVSRATYDAMMNTSMYGNEWFRKNNPTQSKTNVLYNKALRKLFRFESVQVLGLNLISIVVGGGDSIAKMIRDSFAWKYMSPRDLITGILDVNRELPFIIANFGDPVANNKVVGINQLFGIGKDYRKVYANEKWGRLRKGITQFLMGGYSMVDYINNSILLRSFCNNVRFYDGDVVPKGFYTEYELHQAFIRAGKSPKQAFFAHAASTKTLWGAIKYSHGSTWIDPKYKPYVTERVMSQVRRKVLQRGALYNGMNPDNDIARYKRSIGGAFIGAMRAWLTQQGQHLLAGTDDTSVREFDELKEESYRLGLFTKEHKHRILKPRTESQKARRLSWNFETGTPQDEILLGCVRGITKWFRMFYYVGRGMFTGDFTKLKDIKLSYVEKYALRDAVITLAELILLMQISMRTHRWAQSAVKWKPTNKVETSLGYQVQNFFDHDTYKIFIDDAMFRIVESQLSGLDPFTAWDIVSSISPLKNGIEEHVQIAGVASDLFGWSGHDASETLKNGKYKYYTRQERSIYKAVGPLDNLVTSLTYQGLVGNMHWYTSKYGYLFRSLYGFDFKMDKMKDSKSKIGPGKVGPGRVGPGKIGPGKVGPGKI